MKGAELAAALEEKGDRSHGVVGRRPIRSRRQGSRKEALTQLSRGSAVVKEAAGASCAILGESAPSIEDSAATSEARHTCSYRMNIVNE